VKWIEPLERFVETIALLWLFNIIFKSVWPSSERTVDQAAVDQDYQSLGGVVLTLRMDHIGDMAIIECKGRIVRGDAALKLREVVMAQQNVRIVVLDLTKIAALEGGGLGMLWFLQRWAEDHDIRFKLYNPINSVRDKLEHNNAMLRFDIVTFEEMVSLVDHADNQYARAA
jgi:hypothetical protein